LVPSSDSGDDFVWICGPCERLGIMVCLRDETVDGGLEIDHASEDTALRLDESCRIMSSL
jgi:hypothetical protein